MTIHALTEYIRYLWYAKTRHGVHSPFVYDFIERVLMNKNNPDDMASLPVVSYDKNTLNLNKIVSYRYHKLVNRIAGIYNYNTLFSVPADNGEDPVACDFLLLSTEPKVWIRLFNRHLPVLGTNSCIMISDIHKTRRHTGKWKRICKHPKVKLSIDLYGIGLIFFKEEFKEKQSFILRY